MRYKGVIINKEKGESFYFNKKTKPLSFKYKYTQLILRYKQILSINIDVII